MPDLSDINVIDETNSDILSLLFKQYKLNFFQKNIPYTIHFYSYKIKVKLSHDILKRPRRKKTYKNNFRYEVISHSSFAAGNFSQVYPIIKTLNEKAEVVSPNKKRVVKVLSFSESSRQEMKEEAKITKHIDYLRSKDFVCSENNGKDGFIVMKHIKGLSLQKIIENNMIKNEKNLLEISINFLLTLQNLHKKNLIHSDIKPENIIVDITTFQVYIIDFGFTISKKSHSPLGYTLQYVSPELFKRKAYQASDIFSAGITIAELWGAEPRVITEKKEKLINHSTREPEIVITEEMLPNFKSIIDSRPIVEKLGKNLILSSNFPLVYFKGILNKMLQKNILSRATLETTIRRLQFIKNTLSISDFCQKNTNTYSLVHLDSLLDYFERRKKTSLQYKTLDLFKGVVGFGSQIKMRAVLKLYDAIMEEILFSGINNLKSTINFTDQEILALRDGSLGKLIAKFEKLPNSFIEKEKSYIYNKKEDTDGIGFSRMQA